MSDNLFDAEIVEEKGMVSAQSKQLTPMDLISQAQTAGVGVEQMQQLFDLQLRWEQNEARKAFNEAMSQFRDEAPTVNRNRTGHNSKYAGLAETIEAIKPMLSRFGLSHRWSTKQHDNQITVECTVTHRQGHSETTSLTASPDTSGSKNSIQAIGSTVAYLERYTLYAILGLASREMDDDGKSAGSQQIDYISENQEANIYALLSEVKADEAAFLAYFRVESVSHLPAEKYKKAIEMLERKRKEGK